MSTAAPAPASPAPDQPDDLPLGLRCPACGGGHLVVLSRAGHPDGVRVRYRECAACETRVRTREVVERITRRPTPPPISN